MKITRKEFKKICNFLDRIEKPDFTKLDIDDLFENISRETKLKIRNDFSGVENIKILRLLFELDNIRDKYGIKLNIKDEKIT